ncbi:hypothetical protein LEP1GSC128_0821 [Leptospira borgpetersenii str. 200801926]|uniref:Uncharacterized protein n=1 Tax=Leptospira borgpetersenii str. 200801926 TaxID=1193009 RepID=A0ABN0I2U3_LEPBO|nr:hypothetical protein LEP1GSC128_0821 [Leptospira borgpetersenii str. 200801926]
MQEMGNQKYVRRFDIIKEKSNILNRSDGIAGKNVYIGF